jgi:hypothetical protein
VTRILLSAALALAWLGKPAFAAEPAPPLGERRVTVLAGAGVATAGVGLQAELHFARYFSAFGGFGYWPESDEYNDVAEASGAGVAGGLRAYTPGRVHRGFLEVAVSPIAFEQNLVGVPTDDLSLHYGPAVQAGWQMARPGGFTLVLSFGIGHVPGDAEFESETGLVGFIGLGYTWRRK